MLLRFSILVLLLCPTSAFFSVFAKLIFKRPKKQTNGVSQSFLLLKEECGATPACAIFPEGGELDCVQRCLSSRCYREFYTGDPLEPGQVDYPKRARLFNRCLLRLEGRMRTAGLWPPKISYTTGFVIEPEDVSAEDTVFSEL